MKLKFGKSNTLPHANTLSVAARRQVILPYASHPAHFPTLSQNLASSRNSHDQPTPTDQLSPLRTMQTKYPFASSLIKTSPIAIQHQSCSHFGDVADLWPASCALIPTAPRSWRGTFHRSHWGRSLATSLRQSGQCWWWCRPGQRKSLCHRLQPKTQISTDLYQLKCVCCYCESVHYNTYEVLTEVVYTGLYVCCYCKSAIITLVKY